MPPINELLSNVFVAGVITFLVGWVAGYLTRKERG